MSSKYMVLFLVVTLITAGCKKKTCTGVVCAAGEACIDGECQFISLYNCGPHKHLVNGYCVCDSGWFGYNCETSSLPDFEYDYHFSGISRFSLAGSPPTGSTTYIDDTANVFFNRDTVVTRNARFLYTTSQPGQDHINYYIYKFLPPYSSGANYGYVKLRRNPPDTLFFETNTGSMPGGTHTTLIGFRL